jgi:diacylglycerol O-acyltransferase / wax synthase
MATVRLNPLDAAWVLTETRATPNHVGGLLTFRLPPDAPRDFLRQMLADFRGQRSFAPPWNRRLQFQWGLNPLPAWVDADDIDLEYHVRHAALPWPGGERELGELVGRLQSTPIDLARPPWECTIIEGLAGHRFALFIKMHHSLIDGISGMRLLERAMASDPVKSLKLPAFWVGGEGSAARKRRHTDSPSMADATLAAIEGLSLQMKSLPQLAMAFGKIIKRIGAPGAGLAVPFDAPRSVLNGRVREKRRFATQQFPLTRLRTLAEAAGGTINDIVLALCGGALRRFLLERDSLPEQPLTAGIPVSVRPSDDEGTGNAISFIVVTLGTDIADAVDRLAAIRDSVKFAKAHVQGLPRNAMQQYTTLLMAPTILTLLTGIGGRTPPMFNITISNVPGPDKPLYFRGAELLSIFPASIVTHGQALNITCESYNGLMNFGFTACHTSVPSMQKLAVYTAEALAELEAALLPASSAPAADAPAALVRKRKPRAAAKKAPPDAVGGTAAATPPAEAAGDSLTETTLPGKPARKTARKVSAKVIRKKAPASAAAA